MLQKSCVTSPFLLQSFKHYGSEDTVGTGFPNRISPHYTGLHLCNCTGPSLPYFTHNNAPHILRERGERSRLQASKSNTHTLFTWFVLLENTQMSQETHSLNGSICSSKICTYLSALIILSQMTKLCMSWALTHPHTMTDAGFWT